MPYIDTNGVKTYYERHGNGTPIVFVHGGGWDHRQWRPQVESLTDEYEVITYDVRWHGNSGGGKSVESFKFEDLAGDLHALIGELGLDEPVVVGLSMGGAITHTLAVNYPSDPSGIVTYEAPISLGMGDSFRMKLLFHAYFGLQRVLGPERFYSIGQWIGQKVAGMSEPDDDVEVQGLGMTKGEYVRDAMGRQDVHGQKIIARSGLETPDLSRIEVPALAMTGEDPAPTHQAAADTMAEEIPQGERDILPDADHGGNITNPDGFNDVIRDFVESRVES